MDPYLLLALILGLFALAAAGPSLLGRERLAWGYVAEVALWGLALLALAWVLQMPSPFLYLIVLYLVTMRTRLLVDLANALARRGRPAALRFYALAQRLALSPLDRASVRVNQGAALLQAGQVAAATAVLEDALAQDGLGLKLGAACRCNLGLACVKAGDVERGRRLLREAVAHMPASIYARRARFELQRLDAPVTES